MGRGQMQIQETIIVLLIVSIILVLGIVFFFRYTSSSIESAQLGYEQGDVYTLLGNLPSHPELVLSELGDEKPAIDTLKLLDSSLDDLGSTIINIRQVYPAGENVECSSDNYPDCTIYNLYKGRGRGQSRQLFSSPVSLYYPLSKEYKAGILEIAWYY